MSLDSKTVPVESEFDKKFIKISCSLLIIAIAFFTWLHWSYPEVLRVPSNTDVSSWQYPPFDKTLLYNRMTPEERTTFLTDGLPGNNLPEILFTEISTILISLLCFFHARKHWGNWMAYSFILGSFAFTGLQESLWIIFGRFTGMAAGPGLGAYEVTGTYWFTKAGLWFIQTPVYVCFGWFYIAYFCVLVAGKVFPNTGLLGRATIGGLIAIGLDLWQDPVMVSPEITRWIWAQSDLIHILGIPVSNFYVGWFMLIFFFAIVWEQLPKWEKKWGRAKATRNFFLILVAADFGILAMGSVLHFIIRTILILLGVESTIIIPQGW